MKKLLKDGFGWGLLLWVIGYVLGIVLFMVMPQNLIGWAIAPVGTAVALWILIKKINEKKLNYYFALAISWTVIAVAFDYVFIVKLFKSANYYKPDVFLYYGLTFVLPFIVGYLKSLKTK